MNTQFIPLLIFSRKAEAPPLNRGSRSYFIDKQYRIQLWITISISLWIPISISLQIPISLWIPISISLKCTKDTCQAIWVQIFSQIFTHRCPVKVKVTSYLVQLFHYIFKKLFLSSLPKAFNLIFMEISFFSVLTFLQFTFRINKLCMFIHIHVV